MKTRNRLIAMLLCCAMLVSALPAAVIAEVIEAFDAAGSSMESPAGEGPKNDEPSNITTGYDTDNKREAADTWSGEIDTSWYDENKNKTDFTISNAEQLAGLAKLVNEKNEKNEWETFEGKTVRLDKDVNWVGEKDGKPATWTPIGTESHPFKGKFDGNHHTVYNVHLTGDSGANSAPLYVGFFGYVENATVSALRVEVVVDGERNITYSSDCFVGGIAAYAKESEVKDCVVLGEVSALYESINPLYRADCKTRSIGELAGDLSAIGGNPLGQGVIINLGATSAIGGAEGKTITISGSVTAVRFVGQANVNYTGLKIVVGESDTDNGIDNVYIEFENVNSTGSISCTNGRNLYVISKGSANTLSSDSNAIKATSSNVYILGDAPLTLRAAHATSGDGHTGIICANLICDADSVDIHGGAGGKGADGSGYAEETREGNPGAKGGTGGAAAIVTNSLIVLSGNVTMTAGNGGRGGDGAKGGNGPNGTDGGNAYGGGFLGAGYYFGTNGGNGSPGGNGGAGGDGGEGGRTLLSGIDVTVGIQSKLILKDGMTGFGGDAGDGGDGGNGGAGGACSYVATGSGCTHGGNGGNGGTAGNGGKGGAGRIAGNGGSPGQGGAAGGRKTDSDAETKISNKGGHDCGLNGGSGGGAGSYGLNGNSAVPGDVWFNSTSFLTGTDNFAHVYDNTNAGVTVKMVKSQTDNPTGLPYEIKVVSKRGADSRHLGGYYHSVGSRANAVFYYVILAKIPVGYNIGMYSNAIGDNSQCVWLTDNKGTGEWQWYIGKTMCGSTGTFSSLGFVAIYGGDDTSDNIEWRVAYTNIIDGTGASEPTLNLLRHTSADLSPRSLTLENGQGIPETHRYILVNAKMTWEDAETVCEAMGGHLVTITSAAEQALVAGLARASGVDSVWLGAKRGKDGKFSEWITGEKLSEEASPDVYTNWCTGEPNNSAENCAHMYANGDSFGGWNDVRGTNLYAFICEIDSAEDTSHRYGIVHADMTWEEAKILCERMGGHLAVITSDEEQQIISKLMLASGVEYAWIGAKRAGDGKNDWVWVNGEYASQYSNWKDGQPDDYEQSEDYVHLCADGKWNDVSSKIKYAFVIEYEKDAKPAESSIAPIGISKGDLRLGMLIGESQKTSIDLCASIVRKMVYDQTNPYVKVNVGGLVGKADEKTKVANSVATNGENLLLTKSEVQLVGNSMNYTCDEKKNVGILNGNTSTWGLIYSISGKGTGNYEATVSGYEENGTKNEVYIPDYVFDGSFVAAVTTVKMDTDKSHENVTMKTIHIGKNVSSIDFAFVNCKELERYEVSEDNVKYSSDKKGVLYENHPSLWYDKNNRPTINENERAKPVPVAVVHAPIKAQLGDYIFPETIVKIYSGAFANNANLKTVELGHIRVIEDKAFYSCSELTTVVFGREDMTVGKIVLNTGEEVELTKESYSQTIGSSAFQMCQKLETVNLDSPFITKIGIRAFAECATSNDTGLTITLGEKVEEVGWNGDQGDKTSEGDTKLKTPSADTFAGTNVLKYAVAPGNEHYVAVDDVLYEIDGSNAYLAAYPTHRKASVFTVPSKVESKSVTAVKSSAFSGVKNLKKVVLCGNLATIGTGAFENASSISNITIGSNITNISYSGDFKEGGSCFEGCSNLSEIIVKDSASGTEISYSVDAAGVKHPYYSKDGVLYGCAGNDKVLLKYPAQKEERTFDIPSDVTVIGSFSFAGNVFIQSVRSSGDIKEIGAYAFKKCSRLSIIYLMSQEIPLRRANWYIETNPRGLTLCYDPESNGWTEGSVTDQHGNVLYKIEPFAGFPIEKTDTGYYAIVVVDKLGNPINDVRVTLSKGAESETVSAKTNEERETIKAQAGIAMFYNLSYTDEGGIPIPYSLKVVDNRGEYYPYENLSFYLDEDMRVTYVTLNLVPSVSGVNVQYEVKSAEKIAKLLTDEASKTVIGDGYKTLDMNSQTAKINKWLTDKVVFTISCGLDDKDTIESVMLYQGDENGNPVKDANGNPIGLKLEYVRSYADGTYETYATLEEAIEAGTRAEEGKSNVILSLLVSAESLVNGKDLYVKVKTTAGDNGGVVASRLNVQIFELNYFGIDTSIFNGGIHIETPEWLRDILPDTFDLREEGKCKLRIIVDEDSFRIQLGVGIGKSLGGEKKPNENWIFYKNSIRSGEWMKNPLVKENELTKQSEERKLSFNLAGYYEYKFKGIDAQGNCDIQREGHITGTIKLQQTWGKTFIIWIIPVRGELEFSASGKLDFSLVFDKEAAQFCTPNMAFEVEGGITGYAGVGFEMASAGFYGELKTVFVLGIVPRLEVRKWTVKADFGLYAKYDGLVVHWTGQKSLLKWEGVVLDNTTASQTSTSSTDVADSSIKLTAELYDQSNYVLAMSSVSPEKLTDAVPADAEEAYAGMIPKMVQVDGKIYTFYQDDMNKYKNTKGEYDKYNYQKIVYRIYDIKTGVSSEIYVLDDNGFADGAFDAYCDGTDIVIVYTQVNKKITSNDVDNISEYVGSMDVKTAVLSGDGTFVVSGLEEDCYYDYHVQIGVVDDRLTAVWVCNENCDMFGKANSGKPSKIMYSVYENGEWSSPAELCREETMITDLQIGSTGIAYITDSDNALFRETTDGTDKKSIEESTNDRVIHIIELSDRTKEIKSEEAAFFDISFVDGQYVYTLNNSIYIITKDGNGDYVINVDLNAMLLSETIDALSNGYQVLEDATGNIKSILYIANGEKCSNVYAIFCDGNSFGSPVKLTDYVENFYVQSFSAVDFGDKMRISALVSEVIPDGSESGYSTEYQHDEKYVDYPTGYSVGEITFDCDAVEADKEVTLTIPIVNGAYRTLSLNAVAVSVDNGEIGVTKSGFYDEEGKEIEGNAVLPGQSAYLRIKFNPGKARENEYNVTVGESSKGVKLWYSDFVVFGKQVLIGEKDALIVNVTNKGHLQGKYTVTARYNDVDLITAKEIALEPGESQYLEILLDKERLHTNSCIVTVNVAADNEYYTANNTLFVNVSLGSDDGSATRHKFENRTDIKYLVSAANCQSPAIYYKSCSCGEKGTETFEDGEKDSESHVNFGDWRIETEPTCNEPGVRKHTCACGKIESEIIPATGEHTPAEAVRENEVAPTCDKAGSYEKVVCCSKCGAEISRETVAIPSTGVHIPADAVRENEVAPTCDKAGSYEEVIYCSECGVEISRRRLEVLGTGHAWDDGVVTLAPTYEAEGIRTYTCANCNATRTESIPKLVAQDVAQFVISTVRGKAGNTVKVTVALANNPGIVALRVKIAYDTDVLTLTAYETALEAASFGPLANMPFSVSWADSLNGNVSDDFILVTLTFRIKDGAAVGKSAITLTYDPEDVFNSDWQDVEFKVTAGGVEVVEYVPGDINGDGKINMKDLVLLQQYLNDWAVTLDDLAADVNRDGKLNMKDVILLQQYLNDWAVELK